MITTPPSFRTFAPSPPLRDVVERYWIHEGPVPAHAFDRVLPGGREELLVNLIDGELRCYHEDGRPHGRTRGPLLAGLHRGAYTIDTRQQGAVMGVHFKPGGIWSLFGVPAPEVSDCRLGIEDILGSVAGEWMDRIFHASGSERRLRLLDTALCSCRLRQLHPAVAWAAAQIARYPDRVRIAELADESGLSARRFGEIFQREVGLNPKAFARLRRFQRALRHVHAAIDPDWCDLAARAGYADQAHFIREFRDFSGLTPCDYHSRRGLRPHLVEARIVETAAA